MHRPAACVLSVHANKALARTIGGVVSVIFSALTVVLAWGGGGGGCWHDAMGGGGVAHRERLGRCWFGLFDVGDRPARKGGTIAPPAPRPSISCPSVDLQTKRSGRARWCGSIPLLMSEGQGEHLTPPDQRFKFLATGGSQAGVERA